MAPMQTVATPGMGFQRSSINVSRTFWQRVTAQLSSQKEGRVVLSNPRTHVFFPAVSEQRQVHHKMGTYVTVLLSLSLRIPGVGNCREFRYVMCCMTLSSSPTSSPSKVNADWLGLAWI